MVFMRTSLSFGWSRSWWLNRWKEKRVVISWIFMCDTSCVSSRLEIFYPSSTWLHWIIALDIFEGAVNKERFISFIQNHVVCFHHLWFSHISCLTESRLWSSIHSILILTTSHIALLWWTTVRFIMMRRYNKLLKWSVVCSLSKNWFCLSDLFCKGQTHISSILLTLLQSNRGSILFHQCLTSLSQARKVLIH